MNSENAKDSRPRDANPKGSVERLVRLWVITKKNGRPLIHTFSPTEKRAWECVMEKACKPLEGLPGFWGQYTKRELKRGGLRAIRCEVYLPNGACSPAAPNGGTSGAAAGSATAEAGSED